MTRTARQKRIRRERKERLTHCPSGKLIFSNKMSAEIYMSSARVPLRRAYQCNHCKDWHLTSKP